MIKIGVRAHDYGKDDPDKLFARIHGDRFSSVQLAIKKAVAGIDQSRDITPSVIEKIKKAAQRNNIGISVLGVYIEPALKDNSEREKNVSEFIESIPIAKELGADCIATETTSRSAQPWANEKETKDALLRSLWEIMKVAEKNHVTVAIEPVASHTVNTPEYAEAVLKTINSPYLKIIFDPVNLLTVENAAEQDLLWDRSFQCFGDKIAAVHIKGMNLGDNNNLVSARFQDSILHYSSIFSRLKLLPNDFSVLREEINPAEAASDYAFLRNLTI